MTEVSASDAAVLWKTGKLRFLLHRGQREFYDKYRAWETESETKRREGNALTGRYPRVFYLDAARRFGKDWVSSVIAIENALKRPGSIQAYGTAQAKDISSIVIPLFQEILKTCPQRLKPVYKNAHQGAESGFFFPNGSFIRLIGIERNPDAMRGRWYDHVFLSEGAFIDRLEYTVVSVILPMFQRRDWANILINSTPPIDPNHDIDKLFLPDCIDRGAYYMADINANPRLSEAQKQEAVNDAGGMESLTCQRELFCKRVRLEDRVVLPEFNQDIHVKASPEPAFALGFTSVDPGIQDHTAVICAYYDFERGKLVVRRSWSKAGANTDVVVGAMRQCEHDAFEGKLQYWMGGSFRPNPYLRFSDTESRLIMDLNTIHKVKIGAADKQGAEAALHSLRNAFLQQKIEIHPDCQDVIDHLQGAVWNKTRKSYDRHPRYGHYDHVDALKYLWRHVDRSTNPFPPHGVTLQQKYNPDNLFLREEHLKRPRQALEIVKQLLPSRKWYTGR